VLTAAHCVKDRKKNQATGLYNFHVSLGWTDLSHNTTSTSGRYGVTEVFLCCGNNECRPPSYSYDVAVLQLEPHTVAARPHTVATRLGPSKDLISASPSVRSHETPSPIEVATPRESILEYPPNRAVTAGWGLTRHNPSSRPTRLQEVEVPLVSDADALKIYRQYPHLKYVPDLMVAAGSLGRGACSGDSGAPLFDHGSNAPFPGSSTTKYVIGVLSFGIPAGCGLRAEAYTQVNAPKIQSFITSATSRGP
jgi:secreted trypsin-like serine protease